MPQEQHTGPKGRFARVGVRLLSGWTGRIVTAFFLLVSLLAAGLLLDRNREVLATVAWRIRPIWLLWLLIFLVIDLLIAAWFWHLLVARLANYRNFRQSTRICWQANLARRIPTPVWYIANRALLYEQVGVPGVTISLLSTLELIFFLLSGLATALLTLPFQVLPADFSQGSNPIAWLILLPLALLLVHPRLLQKLWSRIRPDIPFVPLRWADTLAWLFYGILAWIFGGLVFFSTLNLIYPLPLNQVIVVVGIWALAGSVSLAGALTFSFVGVREISLVVLLAAVVPWPVALAGALLIRLVWIVGETLFALVALRL
jgi:hypothetical protein